MRFGTEAFYASLGRAFVAMCAVIPVLFLIEAIDLSVGGGGRLDLAGGIIPRRVDGLDGVLFSPFLHAGWDHLYGNAVPLILVGTFALAGGARRFIWSTAVIMLVSGLGVWIVGSPGTVVVGASGVIFGYATYLIARGVFNRSGTQLAVGAAVVLVWGAALVGGLEPQRGISWQGHLFGAIGGVVAARVVARERPVES